MKKNKLTKEFLLDLLDKTHTDALFGYKQLINENKYYFRKASIHQVREWLSSIEQLHWINNHDFAIRITEHIHLYVEEFFKNIPYETLQTEGYEEISCLKNPYYNLFYKIDTVAETITFKLAKKQLTLGIQSQQDFVIKPHYKKWIKTDTIPSLQKHLADSFWADKNIAIGRRLLGLALLD